MDSTEIALRVLTEDLPVVLDDYFSEKNFCFSVAITVVEVLEDLGFDAAVHGVRALSGKPDENTGWNCWDNRSNSPYRLPKHVLVRLEDSFIDVTSAQIAPGFPWCMKVYLDNQPRMLHGYEYTYDDQGEYCPSSNMYGKCFDRRLYYVVRALMIAALHKHGVKSPAEETEELA